MPDTVPIQDSPCIQLVKAADTGADKLICLTGIERVNEA
jgi:hypothetical protein